MCLERLIKLYGVKLWKIWPSKVSFGHSCQYMLFGLGWMLVCPSCHCQRDSAFIAWHEPVQQWEINCLSKGLCHSGALWMDLFSWSDFHSPCCAKFLIAVWMGASIKENSNYPSSSAHADSTVVPFDLFNKGRLPLLSLFELSIITTFIFQLLILLCNCVHGCLCSGAHAKKNFIPFFMDSRGKGCSLFNRMQSTPPLNRIFIYLLSQCHFGLQNPSRGKCIKPLTVFTCVGLMLMCEGRLEDGGWEIDHRWIGVRGILTSTTAFHALSLENPSSRNSSENISAYHID